MIAVRVSEPLYRQIKDAAKQSRATMSETMAGLLKRSFEWDATFAEPKRLSAELLERQKEDLKSRNATAGLEAAPRDAVLGCRLRWRRARAQRAALSG